VVRPSAEQELFLLERAREGDRKATRQLYDCYVSLLTATCSRYLSDVSEVRDVLQDAFIKIFSSLDRFEFRGEGSLKAWMRQITVNEALKRLRSRKRSPFVEMPERIPEPAGEEEPDVARVPASALQEMVRRLPEGYRTVLNLYAFEKKSHREIAELLGITENTSASQLHRARAFLSREINEYLKNRSDI